MDRPSRTGNTVEESQKGRLPKLGETEFRAETIGLAHTISPGVELVGFAFASASGGGFLARDGLWAPVYKKSGTPSASNSCFFVVSVAFVSSHSLHWQGRKLLISYACFYRHVFAVVMVYFI